MDNLDQPIPARLNPFAFPDETEARFTFLIITAIVLAAVMGYNLVTFYLGNAGLAPSGWDFQEPSRSLPRDQYLSEFEARAWQAVAQQIWQYTPLLCVPAGLIGVVALAALVLYRSYPGRLQRRMNLQALTREQDAVAYDRACQLAASAGISPPPIWLIGSDERADGQAFGVRQPYLVRLGGRTRLLVRKFPARFNALLLHELAHIANRDIPRTYFAQALWTSLAWLGFLPCTLVIAGVVFFSSLWDLYTQGITLNLVQSILLVRLPAALGLLFQLGLILLFFFVVQAGLLRAREAYADWRASLWDAGNGLTQILGQSAGAARAWRWRSLLRLHPTAAQRLHTLQHPEELFTIPMQMPFLAGILTALTLLWLRFTLALVVLMLQLNVPLTAVIARRIGLAGPGMLLIQMVIALGLLAAIFLTMLPLLVIAILVTNILGLQVSRAALADLASGHGGLRPYLRLALPAALLMIGIEIGFLMSPVVAESPRSLPAALETVLWSLAMIFPVWLTLGITRFASRRWLRRCTGSRSPAWPQRLIRLATSLLLWGILIVYYSVHYFVASQAIQDYLFSQTGIGVGAFLAIYLLTCVVVLLIAVANGLFFTLLQAILPVTCPACGQRTSTRDGPVCGRCRQPVTPWLFVPPRAL